MLLERLLLLTIIVSLVASYFILAITKLGFREFLRVRSPKFISRLLECDFCLAHWVSFIFALIGIYFLKEVMMALMPILCPPIIRKLVQ